MDKAVRAQFVQSPDATCRDTRLVWCQSRIPRKVLDTALSIAFCTASTSAAVSSLTSPQMQQDSTTGPLVMNGKNPCSHMDLVSLGIGWASRVQARLRLLIAAMLAGVDQVVGYLPERPAKFKRPKLVLGGLILWGTDAASTTFRTLSHCSGPLACRQEGQIHPCCLVVFHPK